MNGRPSVAERQSRPSSRDDGLHFKCTESRTLVHDIVLASLPLGPRDRVTVRTSGIEASVPTSSIHNRSLPSVSKYGLVFDDTEVALSLRVSQYCIFRDKNAPSRSAIESRNDVPGESIEFASYPLIFKELCNVIAPVHRKIDRRTLEQRCKR